jgi:hypothetical protein
VVVEHGGEGGQCQVDELERKPTSGVSLEEIRVQWSGSSGLGECHGAVVGTLDGN